ncbi:MAG: hypothetical protein HY064_16600 [Bacteroidetes bacterium]|nr:hypothetical protein [Bacteroidota bacterium]
MDELQGEKNKSGGDGDEESRSLGRNSEDDEHFFVVYEHCFSLENIFRLPLTEKIVL